MKSTQQEIVNLNSESEAKLANLDRQIKINEKNMTLQLKEIGELKNVNKKHQKNIVAQNEKIIEREGTLKNAGIQITS